MEIWTSVGLGFSSNGYEGPFELAMTMDGQINANFITTGQMNVARIKGLTDSLNEIHTAIELNSNNINIVTNKQNGTDKDMAAIKVSLDAIKLELDGKELTSAAIIGLINNRDGTSTAKIKATNLELDGYLTISNANRTYTTDSSLSNGTTTINGACIKTGTINAERINMTSANGIFGNGIHVTSPAWLAGQVSSPSGDSLSPIIYFGANIQGDMSKPYLTSGAMFWENGEVYIKRLYCESGGAGHYMGYIKTPLSTSSPIDAVNYVVGHTSSGSRGINVNTYAEAFDIYAATSDENLKENFARTKVTAMDYINQIKHIEFNWKENGKFQRIGYGARQLRKICEDFVSSVKQPERF